MHSVHLHVNTHCNECTFGVIALVDSEDTEEPTTKDSEEPTTKDSEEPTIKDSEDSTTKDSEEPTTKDSEVQEEKEIGKSIVCAMECIIKSYSTNPVLS